MEEPENKRYVTLARKWLIAFPSSRLQTQSAYEGRGRNNSQKKV